MKHLFHSWKPQAFAGAAQVFSAGAKRFRYGPVYRRIAETLRRQKSQVVKAQRLPVCEVEGNSGTWVAPSGPQTAKLLGFDGEGHFANFRRPDRDRRVAVCIVVDIYARKDVWRGEVKFCVRRPWIGQGKRKCPKLSVRRANKPISLAPINDTRRILAQQRRSRGKMRIVEGDVGRR